MRKVHQLHKRLAVAVVRNHSLPLPPAHPDGLVQADGNVVDGDLGLDEDVGRGIEEQGCEPGLRLEVALRIELQGEILNAPASQGHAHEPHPPLRQVVRQSLQVHHRPVHHLVELQADPHVAVHLGDEIPPSDTPLEAGHLIQCSGHAVHGDLGSNESVTGSVQVHRGVPRRRPRRAPRVEPHRQPIQPSARKYRTHNLRPSCGVCPVHFTDIPEVEMALRQHGLPLQVRDG
mmetsp:Transcript_8128/g.20041  ORF Transcript_8128/g.20041 Transcript_8128/m.20041 type:complete len:232 (-) Transcript_8128:275-970(-)